MSAPDKPERDIAALVATVASASQRLAEAASRENAGLRGRIREALPALAKEKATAAEDYEAHLAALEEASDGFTLLTEEQRKELRALTGTLNTVADENALLLRVALATSRRLMETVSEAAKELAQEPPGYASDGSPGHGRRPTARTPALSLDRSL